MICAHVKFEDKYYLFTTSDSGLGFSVSHKQNGVMMTKQISPGGGYNDIRFFKIRISEWLHKHAQYSSYVWTSRAQPKVKFISIDNHKTIAGMDFSSLQDTQNATENQ